MIKTKNIELQFGSRKLFEKVNITFSPSNCYGLIGANGSGKSTFLKIISGEIKSTSGEIYLGKGMRLSFLKQDQFAYDQEKVLDTVIMGYQRLFKIMKKKDEIYSKSDFTDEDGIKVSQLEEEFSELNGWNAETQAEQLLGNLGINKSKFNLKMKELKAGEKIKVLLAQALFGNPDILLLDEPTNQLDIETCLWLENFLVDFENTAIVVSHDKHFLDKICTHIADIDFGTISIFPGNYTFWKESSEIVLRQKQQKNKKLEDRKKELEDFVARFSANASKSKQATSRKKILEKIDIKKIKPSSRKYPYIRFDQERELGNDILRVERLSKTNSSGKKVFENVSFEINPGDKIAFISKNDIILTELFQILVEEKKSDSGEIKWGASTNFSYFPKDNAKYFNNKLSIINWLRQYTENQDENFLRGFLGRMLFSGDESEKKVSVLSGGEKIRCMLSKIMLNQGNVLILDEPTNHLDLESISSLNKGMMDFKGSILFTSQDHQLIQSTANRIIEISPNGYIDQQKITFDEYLESPIVQQKRNKIYK